MHEVKLKTNLLTILGLCLVAVFVILFFTFRAPASVMGSGKADLGDFVVVRIGDDVGTGKVCRIDVEFDEKYGAYACYDIDFGILENGERQIMAIPANF